MTNTRLIELPPPKEPYISNAIPKSIHTLPLRCAPPTDLTDIISTARPLRSDNFSAQFIIERYGLFAVVAARAAAFGFDEGGEAEASLCPFAESGGLVAAAAFFFGGVGFGVVAGVFLVAVAAGSRVSFAPACSHIPGAVELFPIENGPVLALVGIGEEIILIRFALIHFMQLFQV